jgi:hypothetical protein
VIYKPLFTLEQLEAASKLMEEADAALMKKYGRLIYAAPTEEMERLARHFAESPDYTVAGALAAVDQCWCHSCRPLGPSRMEMILCPDCGNKRCPKANDHRNACTGSNDPGQPGSAY